MFTALRLRAALVVLLTPLAAVLLAACATSSADQPSSSHTVLFLAPNDTVAADEFDGC